MASDTQRDNQNANFNVTYLLMFLLNVYATLICMNASLSESELFLKDRIILITGASRGIGRAVAKACAAQGATVILLARNVKNLEQVYDEIEQAGHPTPAIYPFNLATPVYQNYEDLASNIEQHFGRLDGIIHNAAMLGGLTPIEHYPSDQWHQVLQVNLTSAFFLTQVTLPLLKKSNNASVIFTSADVGLKARAYWGAYAVSKFGIQALMELLSDELEVNHPIRVNVMKPGKVRTALRASAYPGESQNTLSSPEAIVWPYLELLHPNNTTKGKTIEIADALFVH